MARSPDSLDDAVAAVRRGGVVVYPTETVYGLGGDPTEAAVVERVRRLKGRDASKPMLILTDTWGRVSTWIQSPSPEQRRLMEHEPPLSVTLLFRPGPEAPAELVGPDGWVGVRRASDPVSLALIVGADRAILSTSANPGGEPPPRTFAAIHPSILDGADAVLDAGEPLAGTPSSVVRIEAGAVEVVREGAVPGATIAAIARGEP